MLAVQLEEMGVLPPELDSLILMKINNYQVLCHYPLRLIFSLYYCRRIAEDLQENLPSLETIILTNNGLKELADIDPLSTVTTLTHLR